MLRSLTVWITTNQKIIEELGVPDHLTCREKSGWGQETTVRTRHGTMDWFHIGKGISQGCILSPCLFNFYTEYILWMLDWMKHKLESRLQGEISIFSDTHMNHPYGRKWRTKKPLYESERGEWKNWLKPQHSKNEDHSIWSHHFMANMWGKMETVKNFILLGCKITADGDCSHAIKRPSLVGRKAMINLDSILKSRDITLLTKSV